MMIHQANTPHGTSWFRWFTNAFRQLGVHTSAPAHLRAKYANDDSQYIKIDNALIHYRDEGEGPALVLTHGVMASLHTWDGWVELLKSKYRVIRFDIPGFGLTNSLSREQYQPEYTAELLDKLVDALGLDDFYLVGNSLGGFISWNYAAIHPERVKKLILIDPIGYEQPLPWIMKFVSLPVVRFVARLVAPKFIVDANVRQVYGRPENIHHTVFERYFELLMHPGNRGAMVDVFLTFKFYNGHPEIASKIKNITVPTLLMWGDQDAWVPLALLDQWKEDIPHAQSIVYENAGHIPMEEFPHLTAADADRFLSKDESNELLPVGF